MKALFVTYGGGHVHMVNNVARALTQLASSAEIKILGLPSALPILEKTEFEVLSFADVIEPANDTQVLAWGEELATVHHSDHTGIDRAQSIAYLGLSFGDLVKSVGYQAARKSVDTVGRNAFFPLTALNRAFDLTTPDIVITTNSPRAEAAAIAAANARNIPTIAMVDLFGGIKDYKIEAKDVTVLNEHALEMLCDAGIVDLDISNVHFTGNPAFDSIIENTEQIDCSALKKHIPDLKEKSSVLHADIPAWVCPETGMAHIKSELEILDELTTVWRAANEAKAIYLLRPHPGQPRHLFRDFTAKHKDCYLVDEFPLYMLLKSVDLLVARSTTVALEAVYMRKNILQLEPHLHTDMPLAKMGVAVGAALSNSLAAEIEKCLLQKSVTETTLQNMNKLFPHEVAAPKIASLIAQRTNL